MASTLQQLCGLAKMGGHRPKEDDPRTCRDCGQELLPGTTKPVARPRVPLYLRAAVCQVLVNLAGFADFWTSEGPTGTARAFLVSLQDEQAAKVLDVVGVHDAAHVLAAFLVWDGSGLEQLRPLVEQLPAPDKARLQRMARAVLNGPADVMCWLHDAGGRHG